jgi:hypothetical protein
VRISNGAGSDSSAADFAISAAPLAAPSVVGFTPTSGRVGTSVTVSGSGFTGAGNVAFHGTAARFSVVSDTLIMATVPPGAGSGPITITTPGGSAASAASFTLIPPDVTPPTTRLLNLTTSGWVDHDVTLTLQASDSGGSGLARTEYRFGAGAWTRYTAAITIRSEGETLLSYRSVDNAGNTEAAKSATVRIDKTRPITKALRNATVKRGRKVTLRYRVNDLYSPAAKTVKIRIYKVRKVLRKGKLRTVLVRKKTITLRNRPTDKNLSYRFRCRLGKGRYRWKVFATDLAGNTQARAAVRTLRVR